MNVNERKAMFEHSHYVDKNGFYLCFTVFEKYRENKSDVECYPSKKYSDLSGDLLRKDNQNDSDIRLLHITLL